MAEEDRYFFVVVVIGCHGKVGKVFFYSVHAKRRRAERPPPRIPPPQPRLMSGVALFIPEGPPIWKQGFRAFQKYLRGIIGFRSSATGFAQASFGEPI